MADACIESLDTGDALLLDNGAWTPCPPASKLLPTGEVPPGAVPLLACNLLESADVADCSVRCSICRKAETLGLALEVSSFGWLAPSAIGKVGCVELTGCLRDPPSRGTPLASAAESAASLP